MTTFIHDVLNDLQNDNQNFSELTFVLPSKRAGLFLKHQLSEVVKKTIFAPEILSIEEFVEDLSQIKSTSNTELLFEFYSIYIQLTKKEHADSFESFSNWGQILLQDFNEIDRYLIPQEKIFNYLSSIQDLNHWSLEEHQTDFVKNYLAFWKKLYGYYNAFSEHLINKRIGYQGLIYREAVNNLKSYIQSNPKKKYVFLGFNALNTSEETIIQVLLENKLGKVYWDVDCVFMDNKKHDAALFTRQHKDNWPFFKNNPFNWIA
ncbi:PD-(D/E)XK nuclease family protein, partial [Algibacter sp.]|nr:PD-(D/E)XK nuclease family protein [Algibacter sp.]